MSVQYLRIFEGIKVPSEEEAMKKRVNLLRRPGYKGTDKIIKIKRL